MLAPASTNAEGKTYGPLHPPRIPFMCLSEWLSLLLAEKPRNPKPPKRYDEPHNPGALVAFVRDAETGNRNSALFWAATRMAEDGVSEDAIRNALLPVVADLGDAAERTIASAVRTAEEEA